MLETLKVLKEALGTLIAYLLTMFSFSYLELWAGFGIAVTFAYGLNAFFVLRNHIIAFLDERRGKSKKKVLNTREEEVERKRQLEAQKPATRVIKVNRG